MRRCLGSFQVRANDQLAVDLGIFGVINDETILSLDYWILRLSDAVLMKHLSESVVYISELRVYLGSFFLISVLYPEVLCNASPDPHEFFSKFRSG